jgi:hypothetical protein
LEGEVAEVKSGVAAPAASRTVPQERLELEQERLRSFERDLAIQDQKLSDHAREARDDVWAIAQTAEFTHALAPLIVPGVSSLKDVDCRSKSCVVQVTYESPSEAIARRGDWNGRAAVKGCNGYSSALQPPTSNGPYDVVFIYNCR